MIDTPWPVDQPSVAVLDLRASPGVLRPARSEALPWSVWIDLPDGRFVEIHPRPLGDEKHEARLWTSTLAAFAPLPGDVTGDLSLLPADLEVLSRYVPPGTGRGVWWLGKGAPVDVPKPAYLLHVSVDG